MLRFDLQPSAIQLPTPHDPIFQLEAQVDQIHALPPRQRLALLYNDAKNYETGKIQPWKGWYEKRLPILQEYATLDWLALGEHIGAHTHCHAIHTWLHYLGRHPVPLRPLGDKEVRQRADVSSEHTTEPFDISLFCRILAKIDYLWHTLVPSQLSNIHHQGVKTLLDYFGIQHT